MAAPSKSSTSTAAERVNSISKHLTLKQSQRPADTTLKAKMSTDYKFHGWMGLDASASKGKMEWQEYEPKTWTEDDVDIKVTHCGICGSDIHTLRSGWVSILLEPKVPLNSYLTLIRERPYTLVALAMRLLDQL